jgi:hypothetical protein
MDERKDIRLIIEIKNEHPLELLDLTKSLVSWASQFNTYASKFGDSKENREAKLYVKEIRSGSVILELIEMATIGVLPFLENVNTIVGFADYVKRAYNFFLGTEKETPTDFTTNDYKELSQIVNPIATDNGSQLNVSTTINGNVELHFHINSIEANAAQNKIEKEIKQLKAPETIEDIKTKVLLTWYQARSDVKAKAGNKGLVEDLSAKPMNVTFEDENLKEQMLHGDINPFNTVYVVDIRLQNVRGKLAAYKVIKLHETFEIEEGKQ